MSSSAGTEALQQAFEHCRDLDGSLADQLAAFVDAVHRLTPDFAEAVERLVARLRQNGSGNGAPQPGDPMPRFLLPDEEGHLVGLEELLASGPVAVAFNRGHWCPYCRISIRALARVHAELAAIGGKVVAIVPESQQFAAEFKSDAGASFPILTDLDNGYALSLNLAVWVGAEMERLMGARGRDLPRYQGNDAWILPIPATFVVGGDGIIAARFVDPDYRRRMAIEDLLAALRGARRQIS
jgi:peroxiredoxin